MSKPLNVSVNGSKYFSLFCKTEGTILKQHIWMQRVKQEKPINFFFIINCTLKKLNYVFFHICISELCRPLQVKQ